MKKIKEKTHDPILESFLSKIENPKRVHEKEWNSYFGYIDEETASTHWTSFRVIRLACEFLVDSPRSCILDVGSGVGKFCIMGSYLYPSKYYGFEIRSHLVEISIETMKKLKAPWIHFECTDAFEKNWNKYTGIYLFNHFYEHIAPKNQAISNDISLSTKKYHDYIYKMEEKLKTLKIGTKVVTFHGFGGEFPPEYICTSKEPIDGGLLEFWIKKK